MGKYVRQEDVLSMFNRFFHNLKGNEAQVLVCDMKQAFLELPTVNNVETKWVKVNEQLPKNDKKNRKGER